MNAKIMELLTKSDQTRTKAIMRQFLSKAYPAIVETEDFIFCRGTIPIALVGHLDTVEEKGRQNAELFYDRKKQVMFCPGFPGFDDKAAIYSIIQIIQKGYRPTICLCCDEEVGGLGADALAQYFESKAPSLKYMIELDRRGRNDMVFYDCDNKEFTNYIASFGFELAHGTFTDICFLMDTFGCAAVNLSCGYLNEHTAAEILHVDWMEETIEKVCKMLDASDEAPYFEFIPCVNYWNWMRPVDPNSCYFCGKALAPEERVPVQLEDGTVETFCIDCAASVEVEWCETCGNPFLPAHEQEKICPKCNAEKEIMPYGD